MNTIQWVCNLAAERRGGELNVDVIMRVCEALGISVAEFFSAFK